MAARINKTDYGKGGRLNEAKQVHKEYEKRFATDNKIEQISQ